MRSLANCSTIRTGIARFAEPTAAASGVIYGLANDANFDSSHLNTGLTEFAAGVTDRSDLQTLLDTIAPSVPVGRQFNYHVHNEQAEFLDDSEDDADIRSMGSEFATVAATGKRTLGETHNKGLTVLLDNDQGGSNPVIQQRWVSSLTNRLLRTEIMRTRILLESAANTTAVNWALAGASPDVDIAAAALRSGNARGTDPTICVIGGGAELIRTQAYGNVDRAQGLPMLLLSMQQRQDLYGVESVVRVRSRRAGKAAKNKGLVMQNEVYVYNVAKDATTQDASNIKRFVSPTDQGGFVAVYVEPILKRTRISVEHYSSIALTSPLGIERLNVTYVPA
jgi:hypothetical protein